MPKYDVKCKDVGMDCPFEIRGASSEQELMSLLPIHVKLAHKMETIPPELVEKVKKVIKKS